MSKSKNTKNIVASLIKYDEVALLIIGITTILISLLLRMKQVNGVLDYTRTDTFTTVTNMYTYYKLVGMILLTAFILALLVYRSFKFKIRWRTDYVLYTTGAVVLGSIISALFNPVGLIQPFGYYTRNNGLFTYIALFIFLYLVSNFRISEKLTKKILLFLACYIIFATTIGTFQFFGMDIYKTEWFQSVVIPNYDGINGLNAFNCINMAYSIFPHFNDYSSFCTIFLPFFTIVYVKEKDRRLKLLFGFTSVLLFTGLVTAVSEGGLVTFLISSLILIFLFLDMTTYKALGIIYSLFLSIWIIIAKGYNILTYQEYLKHVETICGKANYIMIILLLLTIYTGSLFGRKLFANKRVKVLKVAVIIIMVLFVMGTVFITGTYASGHKHMFTDRGYVWSNTAELLKENPIIGYGPDNFFYAFPQENPERMAYSEGQYFDKPHNTLLQVYMDTGLIGVIGFVLLLVMSMLSFVQGWGSGGDHRSEAFLAGAFLMIAAYIIQGIVFDNQLTIQPLLYFTMAIGMGKSCKIAPYPPL